jgi:hypothetical protein
MYICCALFGAIKDSVNLPNSGQVTDKRTADLANVKRCLKGNNCVARQNDRSSGDAAAKHARWLHLVDSQ